MSQPSSFHSGLRFFISLLKQLGVALALAIMINIFLFETYMVNGSSMEPTLTGKETFPEEQNGDRLVVFRSAYLWNEPAYGDIVIVDSRIHEPRSVLDPIREQSLLSALLKEKREYIWIKRVIATSGDVLQFKDDQIYRNGKRLEEPYLNEEMNLGNRTVHIPEDMVFVMGDNRNGSMDSRNIGPVPVNHILGKVWVRYWPLNDWSWLSSK